MTSRQQSRVIRTFLVSVVVAALGMMTLVAWYFHTQNEGNRLQSGIVGLQQRMEESVSACLNANRASTNMSPEEFDVIKRVLVNVAMARYENDQAMLAAGGSVVSALHKTRPEIGIPAWDTFTGSVVGCRQVIKQDQERLNAAVADLNTWRLQADLLGVRASFPDKNLRAIDPRTGRVVSGAGALDALNFVIADMGALDAGLMPAQSMLRK